ncbi:membrane-anchored mycosin MYCP [Williamsia maris]|uniref:Membrane-anchored mycosin MYCP n=1 Tax=Williamsia maris TaxID=72806 RepID=A0ABT1HAZ3_9NOCA|nr:membrane-anchored mycosin MYCP [Williamsia maris]
MTVRPSPRSSPRGRGRLALVTRVGLIAVVGIGATSAMPMTAVAVPGISRSITPPQISGPVPSENPVGPSIPTKRAVAQCIETISSKGDYISRPASFALLGVEKAWEFSRGAGQRVAVIDTGVFRHPRLSVTGGGDYVSSGDGTQDCDGHGTAVAGLIAAKDSSSDGFAGIAPDASIIAIRQTSGAYEPADTQRESNDTSIKPDGYGDVATLARAVVRAVNLRATVINISEGACRPAGTDLNDRALGAAVKYAYDRNVVVVAAANNFGDKNEGCGTQNSAALGGADADPWANVVTKSSPAYFSPYVVAVGAVEEDGRPSSYSLAGPWVTVAAPGSNLVSLNIAARPPIIDAFKANNGSSPLTGTSFATPYVSGLAALIRARFPRLTARQVIDRITRTAHHPSDGRDGAVGYGLIDPVAALTTTTPDVAPAGADPADPRTGDTRDVYAAEPVRPQVNPAQPSSVPRYVALGVSAGAVLLALAAWLLLRRRNGDRDQLREGIDY